MRMHIQKKYAHITKQDAAVVNYKLSVLLMNLQWTLCLLYGARTASGMEGQTREDSIVAWTACKRELTQLFRTKITVQGQRGKKNDKTD